MRPAEAAWIGRALAKLPVEAISPLINLGSSDELQRSKERADIWAPLTRRGVKAVHVDYKRGRGIDISGDIFKPETQAQIRAVRPRAILCCNMLEHVPDPRCLAEIMMSLDAGVLIVSVPNSYPYHRDPIDTMFRPDLDALSRLFAGYDLADGEIVQDATSWQTTRQHHALGWIAKYFARKAIMAPVTLLRGREAFRARYHDFLWLFRRYKIACAVFRARGE